MSLLSGEPRPATVVAVEETQVLQISKGALRPIFEANPELVDSISRMVVERKQALDEASEDGAESTAAPDKGVMASIRKFFGMK